MIYTFEKYFGEDDRPRIGVGNSLHRGRIGPHSHTFCELVYVVGGFALHTCAGRTTLLTPGDLFIIPPGIEHAYIHPYRNGVLNFMFCPEDFAAAIDPSDELPALASLREARADAEPPVLHTDLSDRRLFETAFETIREERLRRARGWRTALTSRMVPLLLRYARLYEAQLGESGRALSGSYGYVLQTLAYIEKNYAEDIRMADLAGAAGLNPDYMSRKFKAVVGLSPSEYLRKFRVAHAMELLCQTEMSVSAIAAECGFADVSLFSRVFKNTVGVSPVTFRKNRE